jgi:hypothetical protein
MFKTSARVLACAAALVLLATAQAQAMKLRPQNLTQLITESDSIIAGTVTSVTDGIAANGIPYTEVTISVRSTAKGSIAENADYTFRQFGLLKPRKMDNGKLLLAVAPEGFARWREGETVVAFMYKPAAKTGLQTTAGMAQGKLTLVNDRLANEFDNAGLFDGVELPADELSDAERNMITTPGAVDADTFMSLVGRAVSENWIAKGEMR